MNVNHPFEGQRGSTNNSFDGAGCALGAATALSSRQFMCVFGVVDGNFGDLSG
jgi:hypothetical protein